MTAVPPALPGTAQNKRLKESHEFTRLLLGKADLRVVQIKRLVPWARRATLDPNRSLVAGNRDGEKCSRAVIESGTVFAGSCRSLARFGCQRCAKRDVTGHIIMADGSYRTV
jgi:hypothetical protein